MHFPSVLMIPPEDEGNGITEAPKDGNIYGRKDGHWENIHLEEIDGGYANPDQTLIIDGGTAF